MTKALFTFFLCFTGLSSFAQLSVTQLRIENQENPISVDFKTPHFSWQVLAGNKRNVLQSAYEIKTGAVSNISGAILWQSGKVTSDQSVYIAYQGPALKTGTQYYWQVRIWDNYGRVSPWSEKVTWRMGLLTQGDWKAEWIGPGYAGDAVNKPSPMFRKTITIAKKVKSAIAYITSHGFYEAQINGQKVGDAYLTPGWTSYKNRIQYQVYDVTHM
ncbi:MAG: alpha-L-rhamnosidase, partial [Sphingobacteriales bacterium]